MKALRIVFSTVVSILLLSTVSHAQYPEPCTNVCPGVSWGPSHTYFMAGACPAWITIYWRYACDRFEFSIVDIAYIGTTPPCPFPQMMSEAVQWVIQNNPMTFPPLNASECVSNWRVTNGVCWEHFVVEEEIRGELFETTHYEACSNTQCCWVDFKVCTDALGNRTSYVMVDGSVNTIECVLPCPDNLCEALLPGIEPGVASMTDQEGKPTLSFKLEDQPTLPLSELLESRIDSTTAEPADGASSNKP